jgi:cytochrome c553
MKLQQRNPLPVASIATCLLWFAVTEGRPADWGPDSLAGDQWNIMVIPGNPTAFSGNARRLFNARCAGCHGRDGRAQTPVARQHQVRDLSECELQDDEIVLQILEGTRDRTNAFKMPPFKEKLDRREIESLVPLVKAFRPVATFKAGDRTANPRLVGIVNHDHVPFVILEAVGTSNHFFILRENESHEGVVLVKLSPKAGAAKISLSGGRSTVDLVLHGQTAAQGTKRGSGIFSRIARAMSDGPRKVVLSQANLDVTLFLYSQFTKRTVLRHPLLPAASIDLDAVAKSPNAASGRLKAALEAKGIAIIEDGDKFALVVPIEAANARPQFARTRPLANHNPPGASFPGGVYVNFPTASLRQLGEFYAQLTGRIPPLTPSLAPDWTVSFTTQTALSDDDCSYALEILFAWNEANYSVPK